MRSRRDSKTRVADHTSSPSTSPYHQARRDHSQLPAPDVLRRPSTAATFDKVGIRDERDGALPSLVTTSPPRYLSRRSPGSVAHDESHSPANWHQQSLQSQDLESAENFLKQSSVMGSSPQLAQLEGTSAIFSPHVTVPPKGSGARILIPKKRAPLAPLDLSPPRPAWLRSNEQHPVIRSPHADANTLDATDSDRSAKLGNTRSDSNTSRESTQTHAGLGLGLPFSTSSTTTSTLASISSQSSSDLSLSHYPSPVVPSSVSRSRKRVSVGDFLGSPESPVTDRRGLVGLGELSTPRWTAAVNGRSWGQQPLPARLPDAPHSDKRAADEEGWEGDVLGGYANEKAVRAVAFSFPKQCRRLIRKK